jgi:flagellar protein FlgJ
MAPVEFIKVYYPQAVKCYQDTGIHPIAVLAQAAIESGWAKFTPGNMFFGVKSTNPKEKRQLIETKEVLSSPNVHFPEIISITNQDNGSYLYVIKDWFRAYDTPADSFDDHAKFFEQNSRFANAMKVKGNPYEFLALIASDGYATDPNYAHNLDITAHAINNIVVNQLKLTPIIPIQ